MHESPHRILIAVIGGIRITQPIEYLFVLIEFQYGSLNASHFHIPPCTSPWHKPVFVFFYQLPYCIQCMYHWESSPSISQLSFYALRFFLKMCISCIKWSTSITASSEFLVVQLRILWTGIMQVHCTWSNYWEDIHFSELCDRKLASYGHSDPLHNSLASLRSACPSCLLAS
jgi:hypothetical protein